MKINKLFAGISAAALAATMCSFSTSAISEGATSIDFEDGDCSFIYENIWDGGDTSVITVEDYDGSKQLKVDVQDGSKYAKIWIDMDKIMPRESVIKVKEIELDVTLVPKGNTKQLGWFGGEFGSAGGFDKDNIQASQKNPSWSNSSWECTDNNCYVDGGVAKTHVKRTFLLPTQRFTEKSANPFFAFMVHNNSSAEYTMYLDNIVFTDDNGKTITVGLPAVEETTVEETTAAVEETTAAAEETTTAAAEETTTAAETEAAEVITAAAEETTAAETEAAPAEETTAAPAETEAAPAETVAAASEEPPVKTGNTAAAAIVAVMAVAGAAAVITKKRG